MDNNSSLDSRDYIELGKLLKRIRSEEDSKKVQEILDMDISDAEKKTKIEEIDYAAREPNIKARFQQLMNGSLDPRIKMNLNAIQKEITARVEGVKKDKSRFCILLVDDLTYITRTVSYMLQKENYQVIIAKNGSEGIVLFQEIIPDLVITDVRLPDFNGIVLSKLIRKLDDSMPIIFITAIDIDVDLDIDIEMDMVMEIKHTDLAKSRMAYLRKPILKEVLLETIDRLLSHKGSSKIPPAKS